MNTAANRIIIVGALDRTPASDWVVNTASSLASTLPGVELHFLHVVPQRGPVEAASAVDDRLHDARAYMDHVTNTTANAAAKVSGHISVGNARKEILQLATDLHADLIVVGCHKKSGPGRWLLGSVSQAIVQGASCAVLVARHKEYADAPEFQPACPKCLEVQQATSGATLWCENHAKRHAHGKVHHGRDVEGTGGSSTFIRT